MTEPRRRGVCPGLSAPMPTGDGLLARLMLIEPVSLDAMAGLCAAARRHGNGTFEISARGSLQVRGLTPHGAPLFAAAVAELAIAAQEGVPVIAGIDDGGADVVAGELRQAIADARLALSPKVSVVVDGNTRLHLDALSADVRLRRAARGHEQDASAVPFCLGIGGDGFSATWLGTVARQAAVGAVMDVLNTIAVRGPTARAADILSRQGVDAFHAGAVKPACPPPFRTRAEMIGRHAMRDGTTALGVGLAFGHIDADTLAELLSMAAWHGARAVRPAPDRVLLLIGMSVRQARDLTAAAARLGFMVQADDPRRRFAACAGAPACASGLIPARAIAATLATASAAILKSARDGVVVHISGCPKGCAHPAPAALTFVGAAHGCGVIHDGSAGAAPHDHFDPACLSEAISRIAAKFTEAADG
jgi:precorrin-3B synthase